jgi:hypothetical protein
MIYITYMYYHTNTLFFSYINFTNTVLYWNENEAFTAKPKICEI